MVCKFLSLIFVFRELFFFGVSFSAGFLFYIGFSVGIFPRFILYIHIACGSKFIGIRDCFYHRSGAVHCWVEEGGSYKT